MKTFIIGDIHGCYDELMALLEQMNVQDEDLVVSLGDILDRGPKSLEVYHYFRTRKNALVLMGNHEKKHMKGILNYAQEIVKIQFGEEYQELRSWIKTLPYYLETEDAIIVHAAFEHDLALSKQRDDVLCGSTSGDRHLQTRYPEGTFWSEYYEGDKPIVYGHHVVGEKPKKIGNTLGIDTGSCHGGKLTAIELPGFTVHQVQAKSDYWKEQQNHWQLIVLAEKPWLTLSFETIEKLLTKLQYIDRADVKEYLAGVQSWKEQLETLLDAIVDALHKKVNELSEQHPDDFNHIASGYFFKTFLFKAKQNKLTLEELSKKLETPEKRLELAKALGVNVEGIVLPTLKHSKG